MSNVFEEIGHDIKVAIVDAVEFLPKAEKVIASAIQDQPEIKTAIMTLVQQAATVIGDVSTAAADKGISLTSDSKALVDAEAFFDYFKSTFVPIVEAVYGQIVADVK